MKRAVRSRQSTIAHTERDAHAHTHTHNHYALQAGTPRTHGEVIAARWMRGAGRDADESVGR